MSCNKVIWCIALTCLFFTTSQSQWLETTIVFSESLGDPCALVYNSSNNKVYSANYECDGVVVIDGATNQIITSMMVGNYPKALIYNPTNNKVYCANFGSDNVSIIKGTTNQVDTTIHVGTQPYVLLWNPLNNKVYCANSWSNDISVIDGLTNRTDTTIFVGFWPRAFALNTSNNRIYCVLEDANAIVVINGNNQQIITSIVVGNRPYDVIWIPINNKIYCTNNLSNNVTIIDGETNQVIGTIHVGSLPSILAYNSINNKIYCVTTDGLCIITGDSVITVPIELTDLSYNATNNKLYCANYLSNDVTIIDGACDTVITAIDVGNGPIAFTYNPLQNRTYVANYLGYSISVIRDVGGGIEEHQTLDAEHLMPEIYPNPAKSFLTIRLPQSADRKKLKIFDVSGKLIKVAEKVASPQSHKQEVIISLKGTSPGIYFLRLGKETKKFLVVK